MAFYEDDMQNKTTNPTTEFQKKISDIVSRAYNNAARNTEGDVKNGAKESFERSLYDGIGPSVAKELNAELSSTVAQFFQIQYDDKSHRFSMVEKAMQKDGGLAKMQEELKVKTEKLSNLKKAGTPDYNVALMTLSTDVTRLNKIVKKMQNYDPKKEKEKLGKKIKSLDPITESAKIQELSQQILVIEDAEKFAAQNKKAIDALKANINTKVYLMNAALKNDVDSAVKKLIDPQVRKETHKKNKPLIALAAVGVVAAAGLLAAGIALLCLLAPASSLLVLGILGVELGIMLLPYSIIGLVYSIIYTDDKHVKMNDLIESSKIASVVDNVAQDLKDTLIKAVAKDEPAVKETVSTIVISVSEMTAQTALDAKQDVADGRKDQNVDKTHPTKEEQKSKAQELAGVKAALGEVKGMVQEVVEICEARDRMVQQEAQVLGRS